MNDKNAILIVEDDKRLNLVNRHALESEGYKVISAFTLDEARSSLKQTPPDIILLDVKLPDGSGFDFCREIRGSTDAYILFLTSVRESSGELEGLVSGGDDYLRKPYGITLLRERVRKALNRKRQVPQTISHGPLTLDIIAGHAYVSGVDMLLTQKEFALLLLFAQNADKTMGADFLYEKAWGQKQSNDGQALKKTISRLRGKLKNSGYTIAAERNEGYCFGRE
jgi:DNA-binding response OmpR family regulator